MPACASSGVYAPRDTHRCDAAVLVRHHVARFLERVEEGSLAPLPDFVLAELRGFAVCGDFSQGFVRTACRRCGDEGVEVLCLNMLALTLLALDCEEGFPGLRSLLDSRKNMVSCSAADVSRVLGRSRQHLANRLWFARLQQVPAWRYLGWWTLTAPMRYLLGRSL